MLLEIFRQIAKSFHDFFSNFRHHQKSSYHLSPSMASTASTTSVAALASLAGSSGNFVENGGNGGGGGGILPPHYPPNTRCDYFAIFISRFLKTFSAFSV
jgi:hypothetical protein